MNKIKPCLIFFLFSFRLTGQIETTTDTTTIETSIETFQTNETDTSKNVKIEKFLNGIKSGLINSTTNEILLEAEYSGIYQQDSDLYEIYNNGKRGFYSIKYKKMVVPVEYESVGIHKIIRNSERENVLIVEKDRKVTLLGSDFKPLFDFEYDNLWPDGETRCIFIKNKLKGIWYFDCNCFKVPMIYEDIDFIYGIDGFIGIKSHFHDYFNEKGEAVFKNQKSIVQYRSAFDEYIRKLILVENNKGIKGLYDTREQKFVLPQVYEKIYEAYYENFIVKKKKKFGIVSNKNEPIIGFKYDSIAFLKPLFTKKSFDFFDEKKFDSIIKINMRIVVSKKGKLGLIDLTGKQITNCEYNDIQHLNFLYKLKKENKYVIVNLDGKKITEQTFDDVGEFVIDSSYFKAAVFNNGRMGYINPEGQIVEPINRVSKACGYRDLDELYREFVVALKAENDSILYEFCKKLNPDEYSKEFMERAHYSYRGFPDKLYENGLTVNDVVRESFNTLLDFKTELKERGHLANLEFVNLQKPGFVYEDFKTFISKATESPGILLSGEKKYVYKLGELIKIDGYWKCFTKSRKSF